ncbi:MAG: hypothetical protein K1X31_03790, partial [Gemmatimonadaceae bacterium]|nr:hypothetical protein [Gemmatimonadaceae bacterium]
AITLLASCGIGAGTGTVDGPFAATIVYGRVVASDSTPVANGRVRVEARALPQCGVTMDGHTYTTDATGAYRADLGIWGNPREVCVFVRAAAPDSVKIGADSIARLPVRLDYAADSVRVDFVLQVRPPG